MGTTGGENEAWEGGERGDRQRAVGSLGEGRKNEVG